MIRSFIAVPAPSDGEATFRRNAERDGLEESLRARHPMWIDMVDPTEEEVGWLGRTLTLSPAVMQDLGREDRHPTLLVYPEYLFLSLFQPYVKGNSIMAREVHCLIGESYFVTVRKADTTCVNEAFNRIAQNPQTYERGGAYFLYLTSQYVIDAYYPLLDRISNRLNTLEERLLENGGTKEERDQKAVYLIKQQLIGLRQMVAPQREVLSSVIGEQRLASDSDIRDLFRHLYERMLRIYDVIDSQRDLSSNVLDMAQNQEAKALGEAVSRLTIFSMIFLPLTFFTSLFELGFVTTPDPIVLPVTGGILLFTVVTAMVTSTFMMLLMFRRRGWL